MESVSCERCRKFNKIILGEKDKDVVKSNTANTVKARTVVEVPTIPSVGKDKDVVKSNN